MINDVMTWWLGGMCIYESQGLQITCSLFSPVYVIVGKPGIFDYDTQAQAATVSNEIGCVCYMYLTR